MAHPGSVPRRPYDVAVSKRRPRRNNLTDAYLDGELAGETDDELGGPAEKYGRRSKHAEDAKTAKTADLYEQKRLKKAARLPMGRVVQVYSLFLDVEPLGDPAAPAPPRGRHLCVVRKTLRKVSATQPVVGDRVRFAVTGGRAKDPLDEAATLPEGVIEHVEDRRTVLTRAAILGDPRPDPIVANAGRFLIVASLLNPWPRWGLVDRMLIAATGGGLEPVIVLNKTDLDDGDALPAARPVLGHYRDVLGVETLETSVEAGVGLTNLRALLDGRETVLAGHSGVGKSSLIAAVVPGLDLRVAAVSQTHDKGRHTTTSARRFPLPAGGAVIDTPGVKVFGLWNVTPESLLEVHYPDVKAGTAPDWRRESYDKVLAEVTPDYHRPPEPTPPA